MYDEDKHCFDCKIKGHIIDSGWAKGPCNEDVDIYILQCPICKKEWMYAD